MPGQVLHRDQRQVERYGQRLGEGDAHQQRADEAGSLRHRDGVDVGPVRAGIPERAFHHAADVAHVLPGRELGHHAAPFAVDFRLRGDHVGPHCPGPRRVAGIRHHRGGRLVARCLDGENIHRVDSIQAPTQAAARLSP